MPMRGELRPVAARSYSHTSAARIGWSRLHTAISDPGLQAVFFFCGIGFLLTVNAVLRFPDFGETIAQLALFP